MQKMTGFQRVVVGLAAVAVALRAFLPVTQEVGYKHQVLLAPTLLHMVGIVVLAAAVFVLFPSPRWRIAATVALTVGWLLYLVFTIAILRKFGIATSWNEINWRATSFTVGSPLILAVLTWWLWNVGRRK